MDSAASEMASPSVIAPGPFGCQKAAQFITHPHAHTQALRALAPSPPSAADLLQLSISQLCRVKLSHLILDTIIYKRGKVRGRKHNRLFRRFTLHHCVSLSSQKTHIPRFDLPQSCFYPSLPLVAIKSVSDGVSPDRRLPRERLKSNGSARAPRVVLTRINIPEHMLKQSRAALRCLRPGDL